MKQSRIFWMLLIGYAFLHFGYKTADFVIKYYSVEHGEYCDILYPKDSSLVIGVCCGGHCKNSQVHPNAELEGIGYVFFAICAFCILIIFIIDAIVYLIILFNKLLDGELNQEVNERFNE